MNFQTLSAPLFLAGAIALTGVLYLLQKLRTQRRVVYLPTAALWRQAVEESPLRVRGPRFKYWAAYLLALAIALLLWTVFANPIMRASDDDAARSFYLDMSATMSGPGLAEDAKRALIADVTAMADRDRTVILGDAFGSVLLAPGESTSLLNERLEDLKPAAQPSSFQNWLRAQSRAQSEGVLKTVRYYGSAAALPALSPENLRISPGFLVRGVPENRGIVSLGASPAASGLADRADVLLVLTGPSQLMDSAEGLDWTLDDQPYAPEHMESAAAGRFVLRDVVAGGATLRVAFKEGDAFEADDSGALRLPDRRPVRVGLAGRVPALVRQAIEADAGLTLTPIESAQVLVAGAGAVVPDGLPALRLVATSNDRATFVFSGIPSSSAEALAAQLDALGLDQLDAGLIADETGRPIAVDVRADDARSIEMWNELFAPGGSFARSAVMPIFLSRGLRWLAGTDPWIPYAAAGTPSYVQDRIYGLSNQTAPETLGAAGVQEFDGQRLPVSFTDPLTSRAVARASVAPTVVTTHAWAKSSLLFSLLLAALVLLGGEWWLFQRGRIP